MSVFIDTGCVLCFVCRKFEEDAQHLQKPAAQEKVHRSRAVSRREWHRILVR